MYEEQVQFLEDRWPILGERASKAAVIAQLGQVFANALLAGTEETRAPVIAHVGDYLIRRVADVYPAPMYICPCKDYEHNRILLDVDGKFPYVKPCKHVLALAFTGAEPALTERLGLEVPVAAN